MGIHKTVSIKSFGSNTVELCEKDSGGYIIYGGKVSHPKYAISEKTLERAKIVFDKLVYLFGDA